MNPRAAFRFATTAFWALAAQLTFGQDLATRLADPELRYAAVNSIVDSGGKDLALLLSWTETPPKGVDEWALRVGLADAFGKLRAKEAIPFLVRNIGLERYFVRQAFWTKADSVIVSRLPAAAALIAIGPDASKALIAAPWNKMSVGEHLAAIYTVSRIADPGARDFLMSVHAEGSEVEFVEEGLKAIQETASARTGR
jgi:hypothetical protein